MKFVIYWFLTSLPVAVFFGRLFRQQRVSLMSIEFHHNIKQIRKALTAMETVETIEELDEAAAQAKASLILAIESKRDALAPGN